MDVLVLPLIVTLFGIVSILVEAFFDKDPNQPKKNWKWITRSLSIASFVIGGSMLFIAYQKGAQKDLEARQELDRQQERHNQQLAAAQQIQDSQKEQILQAKDLAQTQADLNSTQKRALELSSTLLNAQGRGLQQLKLLTLDRTFSGIEISYKPTVQEWKRIVQIYRTIPPPKGEPSYLESPIIATRAGAFWRIDFEPVSLKEGLKWFPAVSTEDQKNIGFEAILRTASLPLSITWGNGAVTFLEAQRGDYPTEIRLSPEVFTFTLRPPQLELSLASLHVNPVIILRSSQRWRELTFHSLDQGVKLDETLHLDWRDGYPKTTENTNLKKIMEERVHRYVSGPHRLKLSFRTLAQ